MVKFLIATHGHLAGGFKSTLQIILGKEAVLDVTALDLFVEETPGEESAKARIEGYFQALSKEDQVVAFSDIMYGSVNQMLMPYADDERIFVLSGVNFPLICEVLSAVIYSGEEVSVEMLHEMAQKSRGELLFVNEELKKETKSETEETFFE